jgi:hypothetical protein
MVSPVEYMIISPTFARTELVATVRQIPIFDDANAVVTAAFDSTCNPFVRSIAVPLDARIILVISALAIHRPFAPL